MFSTQMFVSSVFIGLVFSPLLIVADLKSAYETQIQKEFLASNIYLSFAHALSHDGVYPGFAKFFFDSAEEEREHGEKLIDFGNVLNFDLKLSSINVEQKYATMKDVTQMIKEATNLEQQVYDHLNFLRTESGNSKNYALVHFVEKEMLEEQTTALKYIRDLNKRIERSPTSKVLLQMLDEEFREKN